MSKHRGEMTRQRRTEIEKRGLRDQGRPCDRFRGRERSRQRARAGEKSDGHFEADKGRLSETEKGDRNRVSG